MTKSSKKSIDNINIFVSDFYKTIKANDYDPDNNIVIKTFTIIEENIDCDNPDYLYIKRCIIRFFNKIKSQYNDYYIGLKTDKQRTFYRMYLNDKWNIMYDLMTNKVLLKLEQNDIKNGILGIDKIFTHLHHMYTLFKRKTINITI